MTRPANSSRNPAGKNTTMETMDAAKKTRAQPRNIVGSLLRIGFINE